MRCCRELPGKRHAERFDRVDTHKAEGVRRWKRQLTPASRSNEDHFQRFYSVQRKIVVCCPSFNIQDFSGTRGEVRCRYHEVRVVSIFGHQVSLCDWVKIGGCDHVRSRTNSGTLYDAAVDACQYSHRL